MSSSKKLARLFSAIGAKDWDSAQAIALEMVSREEGLGHHALARQLRGSLIAQRAVPQSELLQVVRSDAPLSALSALHGDVGLGDVRLTQAVRTTLTNLVVEFRRQEELKKHGLDARRRILIHGPPGCGKSMTARALAHELGLPIFVVRLDAVVGAYLGQTASRVRELFRYIETIQCVLLIDEIDALGRTRGHERDVGELDRVVISLMQELEHSQPRGVLVATSNMAASLDRALLRRFDLQVEFRQPKPAELLAFSNHHAALRKVRLDIGLKGQIKRSKSYAEAMRLVTDAHRAQILRAGP